MKYVIILMLFFFFSMRSQSVFERAENCYKFQQYDQAKLLFEKSLQQHPNDLKSMEYLGDIQSHQQHWEKAVSYYEKLKNLNPANAEYHYKYGGALAMVSQNSNILTALGNVGNIKSAFLKAISLNPSHISSRWALIELYLQLPAIFGGSEKKAIQYSKELFKISPVDGYLSKGRIDEYYKRYVQAERQYIKAIEIGNSKTTYQKLADLYKNKMDQPQKAREVLMAFNEKNKS
jgi:tetratricopeptide (TPR) repeat protein